MSARRRLARQKGLWQQQRRPRTVSLSLHATPTLVQHGVAELDDVEWFGELCSVALRRIVSAATQTDPADQLEPLKPHFMSCIQPPERAKAVTAGNNVAELSSAKVID